VFKYVAVCGSVLQYAAPWFEHARERYNCVLCSSEVQ